MKLHCVIQDVVIVIAFEFDDHYDRMYDNSNVAELKGYSDKGIFKDSKRFH